MHYILMCRSLTASQKAARVLQKSGIFAAVTKAPQSANPSGCTYGVKIGQQNLTAAMEVLRGAGVSVGKVLSMDSAGTFREVWHDIS